MKKPILFLLLVLCVLCGCETRYTALRRQSTPLSPGLNRDQVTALLGAPDATELANGALAWQYIVPYGPHYAQHRLTLTFEQGAGQWALASWQWSDLQHVPTLAVQVTH